MSHVKRKFLASRRYGVSIWGQSKDPVSERKYPPGQHGVMGYGRKSEFAKQLMAKQMLRFFYLMDEKQFRKLFKKVRRSSAARKGDFAVEFINKLESRLATIVYRAKFAPTMPAAQQMVSHGHIEVNGKRVTLSSFIVKPGSTVKVRAKMSSSAIVIIATKSAERSVPDFMIVDYNNMSVVFNLPNVPDVGFPFTLEMNRIIAFYSQ